MKGHDGCFGKTGDIQKIGDLNQNWIGISRKNSGHHLSKLEIKRAAKHISHNHGWKQKKLGCPHKINQVFAGAAKTFLVLMMGDQRIGKDGNDFVEQI